MALSDKEQMNIVFYLGWSGLTLVNGSTQFNSVVNDRLTDAAANFQISSLVKGLLEKLVAFDESLVEAKCRLAAKKVDDVTTNPNEIKDILRERKRCTRELSDLLDIPLMKSGGVTVGVTT